MKRIDVGFEYYHNVFNCGSKGKLGRDEFERYLSKACGELDAYLCSDGLEQDEENIRLCLCEIAEILYAAQLSSGIKSENVDGYSVTYSDKTEVDEAVRRCVLKRLGRSGLLFAGVE